MEPFIGIAVTTCNRKVAYEKCMDNHLKFRPRNSVIITVDDASIESYSLGDKIFRFEQNQGISKVKNKCIEILYNMGCSHFMLYDDDAYPLCDNWHLPYIHSGKNHLCRTFYKPYKSDGNIDVFRLNNGSAMFYKRICFDTVGGFDLKFKNKFEHIELTRRIHNSGLTDHMFQDVKGSNNLIYCMDEFNEVKRSFTNKQMQESLRFGYEYFNQQRNSSAFIEFRT